LCQQHKSIQFAPNIIVPSLIFPSSFRNNILTVIDIENKFIVFSSPIDNVVAILIEWGTCFIITADKTVYHLDEKDLQSKLNILFKKNLYDIAVSVAKSCKYGADGLADIFKQYGDHLYTKGDFSSKLMPACR
jgi:vacuolar protein sorting-associated protein 11